MSIRPLDMQVMVPKLQEASQIKQVEQQKASINQQTLASTQQQQRQLAQQTVIHANEDEALRDQMDAKEKGKNPYESQQGKKKKENDDETEPDMPIHRIDIRV